MSKCDDKSGYDHVLLKALSQTFVGFEWSGWCFVAKMLPFGWKESPFVYHSIGLAVSSYLRLRGIPCLLYIDDRLTGEVVTRASRGKNGRMMKGWQQQGRQHLLWLRL